MDDEAIMQLFPRHFGMAPYLPTDICPTDAILNTL